MTRFLSRILGGTHLRRLRSIYHAVLQLPDIALAVQRIERQVSAVGRDPIDRYLATSLARDGAFLGPAYVAWSVARIDTILDQYGLEWFKGRRILEVGGGHGDIGAFFASLGAQVLCLEGRARHARIARLRHRAVPGFECVPFDLEGDFSRFGTFDLVIDVGLLYHLRNVERHLGCCFGAAGEVVLESAVCDSTDPYRILVVKEDPASMKMALHGVGSRPSPFFVERLATERGFTITRLFLAELNAGPEFCYDWTHRDDGSAPDDLSLRRMWRFSRPSASLAQDVPRRPAP
jgi:SAM-dependent methyltransferase